MNIFYSPFNTSNEQQTIKTQNIFINERARVKQASTLSTKAHNIISILHQPKYIPSSHEFIHYIYKWILLTVG